jgi:hypothetical protein
VDWENFLSCECEEREDVGGDCDDCGGCERQSGKVKVVGRDGVCGVLCWEGTG